MNSNACQGISEIVRDPKVHQAGDYMAASGICARMAEEVIHKTGMHHSRKWTTVAAHALMVVLSMPGQGELFVLTKSPVNAADNSVITACVR